MSDRLDLREAVLIEARTWLKTPFHHLARCKGAGVDCGQFLLEVYHRAECMPYVKTEYYPKDFHLHRDREWYKEIVSTYCIEVDPPPLPADIVLYKMGRVYSHGAIIVDWPKIIHAHTAANCVAYADGLQGWLKGYEYKFFRPIAFNLEN